MKKSFLFFILLVLLLDTSVYSTQPTAISRVLIEIPNGTPDDVTSIAIDRIRKYIGLNVVTNVIATPAPKEERAQYDLTIVLGSDEDSPELKQQWKNYSSPKDDAWLLHSMSKEPLVILASGINERGILYAAYNLADLLKAEEDISELDLFFQPKVAERYVTIAATTHRRYYRPNLFYQSLDELPRYGYNGLLIYPGAGTPIAKRGAPGSSPVFETKDGKLYVTDENTKKWKDWFSDIREYQLDIMMTIPPLIPSGYDKQEINDFYAGGHEPEGYIADLQSNFRQFLTLFTNEFPEIDRYLFNSTEGATFGRNKRFFGHPEPEKFSIEEYSENNEKIMTAYFDVLTDFFGKNLHKVGFWTHSFGLTSEGIAQMREILFQYPEILILEDDYWNNNLWPMDIPAMKFLPKDLRAKIHTKNPFGMYQIASDGEYYGGGSLPNAYPESHIRSANDAVGRNATMVIQRNDLHARTPYGTLFGTVEIIPFAASKQLWHPTPPTDEIWMAWANRRFGKAAAPFVVDALQESKTVLLNGLSCNGVDLLAVGSEFNPRLWYYDKSDLTRFHLFSGPNRRMVDKTAGDIIYSEEYTMFQMNTHTIAIADYLKNQDKALKSIHAGLKDIEKAKPHLDEEDYQMLINVFVNGENVIEALKLLGKAAYAGNILLSNYDNIKNPVALFNKSMKDLEAFINESKEKELLIPGMNRNLARIAENFRKIDSVKAKK